MDSSDTEGLQPFYNEYGQIQDPEIAEKLAYEEKPARDMESNLRRQAESGLTEQQKANIELMDGLEIKYPLAFDKVIDDEGRKLLCINTWGDQNQTWGLGDVIFVSQEGIFSHITRKGEGALTIDRVDATELLNKLSVGEYTLLNSGGMLFPLDVVKNDARKYFGNSVVLNRLNLSDEIVSNLKGQLERQQASVAERKQTEEAKQKKLDIKGLLDRL